MQKFESITSQFSSMKSSCVMTEKNFNPDTNSLNRREIENDFNTNMKNDSNLMIISNKNISTCENMLNSEFVNSTSSPFQKTKKISDRECDISTHLSMFDAQNVRNSDIKNIDSVDN